MTLSLTARDAPKKAARDGDHPARFRRAVEARIPSDVVCAAAETDPGIWPAAGPFLAMQALPSVLDPVQDKARAVLRIGWRPPYAAGPSRDELADACLQLQDRSAA